MQVLLHGFVGPQAVRAADNSTIDSRLGVTGDRMFSELNGRYYEQVRYGNVFTACNTAVQALSLNSTTATGLILSNPAQSGKALVLVEVCVAVASAPAAASALILTGSANALGAVVVHTTPLVVQSSALGGPIASVAKADSSATLPAATIFRAIGGGPVATGSITSAPIRDEIAGALILAPNTCISLQALTTAISVVASMTWVEIPL